MNKLLEAIAGYIDRIDPRDFTGFLLTLALMFTLFVFSYDAVIHVMRFVTTQHAIARGVKITINKDGTTNLASDSTAVESFAESLK